MADTLPNQGDSQTTPHTPSDPAADRHKSRVPAGLGKEPLNILILGASFAGLSCAHHFLDYTYSKLNTSKTVPPYRLVIISPSTHIYWNIGAPRAIVGPDLLGDKELFREIEEGFHRHRGSGTVFVQGEATGLDLSARVVKVSLFGREAGKRANIVTGASKRSSKNFEDASAGAGGKTQLIPYHALIIATGSSAHSELLSLHGTHLRTLGALTTFHARAAAASSIVVCGGGSSGVECAGQLATYLNYTGKGPMRRKVKEPKHITLITGGDRCLPNLKPGVGLHAEKKLKRLGVEIRHGVRVLAAKEPPSSAMYGGGQTTVMLNDDTNVTADLYIPCTGVEPNSRFAPAEVKDRRGYITTHPTTLRLSTSAAPTGAGVARVYAIGDVASYSQNYVLDVYAAVPVVMHNLLNDLLAYEYTLASPYGGNQDKIDELIDEEYTGRVMDSQLCPISRFGGSGILLGFKVPSWVVHVLKGRDYRVGKAGKVVLDGGNPYAVRGRYE